MSNVYHVSNNGDDTSEGSKLKPFKTISKAALLAEAGDTVLVHEGCYREWIKPVRGGKSDLNRITYKAADGEKVIIKGSEVIKNWEHLEGSVWKANIPNCFFNDFNPYKESISGDWFLYPEHWAVHAGEVYLNGKSFYEAKTLDEVKNPVERDKGFSLPLYKDEIEYLLNPEDSLFLWFAQVNEEATILYANFHGADPNRELTEINVRKACFYPVKTGIDYITVRGFEMAQAATLWAPPTSDQVGLLGPNWSKGWIVENNTIHDSKCSAISIGKEASTGDMDCSRTQQKSGYQYQMESVFKALQIGWSKETVGSHIIRNNVIHDCGQNGIVGNLGCVFSEISDNHIYNIGKKHEYFGWEIAGIKLHSAIDVVIRKNRIHDCTLGLWLDWQAQGARVSQNLFYQNDRDSMIEVTHGPLLFDNNILASRYSIDNHAQGTAFVNNLFCGAIWRKKVLNRSTPYHFPHSTGVSGYAFVYGGDERLYNNLFVGLSFTKDSDYFCGTDGYDSCHSSYEEYYQEILAKGLQDEEKFAGTEQPVYIDGNAYLKGANPFRAEQHFYKNKDDDPPVKILEDGLKGYLEITVGKELLQLVTEIHSTGTLGTVRLLDAVYDDSNGNSIILDKDFFGNNRSGKPVVGPIENLEAGVNKIRIW
jgi:hypothetical protein